MDLCITEDEGKEPKFLMDLKLFATLYALSIPLFIVGDLLWLGVIAKDFYATRLGSLLGDVQWLPAILFYALFLFGVTFFVTYPTLEASVLKTIFVGGLFGLITYATYDLTNHATLAGWSSAVTVVDMVWGTVLGASVAVGVKLLYRLLFM